MNAYKLKCLKDMGVNVGDLGCVMLDLDGPDLSGALDPDWAYHSSDPKLAHVRGIQTDLHLTLLYGLLQNAHRIRGAIDEVLDGWEPQPVRTDQLDVFQSPLKTEPYVCIVARQAGPDSNLRDAHARLSLLPHIDTHPRYKAHVTLAYVRAEHEESAVRALRDAVHARDIYVPLDFTPTGLNYGKEG